MNRPLTILSILLSLGGAAAALLGYPLIGAGCALAGFLPGLKEAMSVTLAPQKIAPLLADLVLGFSLDRLHGGPPLFIAVMLCSGLGQSLRILIFPRIGYTGMTWYEPLMFVAALSLYVGANLVTGLGWAGWAFPVLPLFMQGFAAMGALMDRKDFANGKKQSTKAEEGTVAPDFCLNDHEGKPTRLSDFRDKNVLLMFVRGDWCPSCHIMLRTFEKNRHKFAEKNVTLLAVGPDNVDVNREMVKKLELEYRLLADDKQEVIRTYGIYIQEGPNPMAKYEIGSPLPASFLIDKSGVVRCISRADRAADFVNPGRIFEAVASLN